MAGGHHGSRWRLVRLALVALAALTGLAIAGLPTSHDEPAISVPVSPSP